MLIPLLTILVFPLVSSAEQRMIDPTPCPEDVKDGDEYFDDHFQYVCKDGQPDFVGCRDEVNGTSVIKMNETGVYYSDEYVDLVLNCTTFINDDNGHIRVNPTVERVMKGGCLYNDTLLKVNETAKDGDDRYTCKQFKSGFQLQNYTINDCLFKEKYYKSNQEHVTGNKKNLRYVYFCNAGDAASEQSSDVSRFALTHCLTPKGAKIELEDSITEDGKDYTCKNGSKKKKREEEDKEKEMSTVWTYDEIKDQVFVSYRLLIAKQTAPIYKLIVVLNILGIFQFVVHLLTRHFSAFYEFSFLYGFLEENGIEWIFLYLMCFAYTFRIHFAFMISLNRFFTFRPGKNRWLYSSRAFNLSLISIIIPFLFSSIPPLFAGYHYVGSPMDDGRIVYRPELRKIISVVPPLLYFTILAICGYVLNGYVIYRLIILRRITRTSTLKSVKNNASERGLALTSVWTMLSQTVFVVFFLTMLIYKTKEAAAFNIIPLTGSPPHSSHSAQNPSVARNPQYDDDRTTQQIIVTLDNSN
ncbi:hypothetical protein PRIPAC_78360 [Pristionchus pacificus]|uniref:Uncharacterized protein n=1 Tax=Pristionchus pacificus TaxID=54126 RepID=A0A2A6BY15_PRIPA|nr:hypothetical protein PRIPAC_78360 [Pristionchus pacificus]|eukprot:PDM70800.1 hypothetical protein PRIPAC_45004 [Pristionchus pacificus]